MRKRGAWDDDDVMEKNDRLEAAKAAGEVIYIAEIMSIASIKHWETPAKRRRKGRIVLRGDDVRDAWGSAAVFGQLYSLPTNVQAINIALSYGMLRRLRKSLFAGIFVEPGCRKDVCLSS